MDLSLNTILARAGQSKRYSTTYSLHKYPSSPKWSGLSAHPDQQPFDNRILLPQSIDSV
jgi:hypothetical protein